MHITEIITVIATLVFLEGILSLDNAAILGVIASRLPADKDVPWPKGLTWLKPLARRTLGSQRQAALKVGLLGAYLGRILMLILASWIVQNPWLKVIGALYLLKLGLEGISIAPLKETGARNIYSPVGFWSVVAVIELVDLVFSLDNVLAAVAISDKFWVIFIGVALGIASMRFAAGIFTQLLKIESHLARAAYILVMVIAIELLLEEFTVMHFEHWQRFTLSLLIIAGTFSYRHLPESLQLKPVFQSIGVASYRLDEGTDRLFLPVRIGARFIFVEILKPTGLKLVRGYTLVEQVIYATKAYIASRLRRRRNASSKQS